MASKELEAEAESARGLEARRTPRFLRANPESQEATLPERGAADVDGRRIAVRAARSGGGRREKGRGEKNHCGDGRSAHASGGSSSVSSPAQWINEDELAGQHVAAAGAGRRRAVHVEMAADDRAARILGAEPAASRRIPGSPGCIRDCRAGSAAGRRRRCDSSRAASRGLGQTRFLVAGSSARLPRATTLHPRAGTSRADGGSAIPLPARRGFRDSIPCAWAGSGGPPRSPIPGTRCRRCGGGGRPIRRRRPPSTCPGPSTASRLGASPVKPGARTRTPMNQRSGTGKYSVTRTLRTHRGLEMGFAWASSAAHTRTSAQASVTAAGRRRGRRGAIVRAMQNSILPALGSILGASQACIGGRAGRSAWAPTRVATAGDVCKSLRRSPGWPAERRRRHSASPARSLFARPPMRCTGSRRSRVADRRYAMLSRVYPNT